MHSPIISNQTTHRIREGWTAWRRQRYHTGYATGLAWVEHGAPPDRVYFLGSAAVAGVFDTDQVADPTTAWKWVVGADCELDSHTVDEGDAADTFWRSLGAQYDEYFGYGFMTAVGDAYEQAFEP